MLAAQGPVWSACRDCAQPGFGGPGENRFTAYDSLCRGEVCGDPGAPQVSINLSSLALFVRAGDLAFGGSTPAFALERSYNQDDSQAGPFGAGWSFNLGEALVKESGGVLLLRRGSGRLDRWAPAADSNSYFAITATADVLSRNGDGTYTLRSPGSNTTKTFAADGRLLAILDSGAARVSLEYDGTQLKTARYRGRVLNFAYDANGRIASVTDSAGRTVRYTYTPEGRLARTENADGRTVTYEYDGAGLLSAIGYRDGTTAISYSGDPGFLFVNTVKTPDGATRTYDIPRNPTEIRRTDGNGDATLYTSNALGEVTSITDASGGTTTYSYDAAGRRIRTVNGAGEAAVFTYDASGNLTGVTDGAGNRWTAAYTDAALVQITDPRGNAWRFRYDAAGNLVGVTDGANGTASATRSASGQITAISDTRGNRSAFTYNDDGLLTGFTDPLGGAWSYEYDGAARVGARVDPGNSTLKVTYTSDNRIESLTAGDARITFDASGRQRDSMGRLASYTDSFGNQLTYTYDAAGQLSALTLPGGKTITYQYDHAGRLSKVSDWAGNFAVYRYDAAGWPASVSVSGGPVTLYQYDNARRLRAIVSTGPDGNPIAAYRYTLDAAGNRTSVSALEPASLPGSLAANTETYDAANHPLTRSDGQSYEYDARSNLTAIRGPHGATFAYDAFGRLQSMSGESNAVYGYDSAGLRVARTIDGAERRFVYDLSGERPRLVMEADGSNAAVAYYVYGLGLLWKVAADGTAYFYHFDGDGNVVAVSNPSAGVVNRYRYDPLGRLVSAEQSVANPFRLRGESGWIDDGNGVVFTGESYRLPDLLLTLPAMADPAAPNPDLLPQFRGAADCFFEGVGRCRVASGRREPQ